MFPITVDTEDVPYPSGSVMNARELIAFAQNEIDKGFEYLPMSAVIFTMQDLQDAHCEFSDIPSLPAIPKMEAAIEIFELISEAVGSIDLTEM